MTSPKVCRVVIAHKTGLLGHGLQSLLEHAGSFEVVTVFGATGDLAEVIKNHTPHVIIVEKGALNPVNAQAVLEAALARPTMSVVSVSLDVANPTLWRALGVVAEEGESVVDALRRHLSVSA